MFCAVVPRSLIYTVIIMLRVIVRGCCSGLMYETVMGPECVELRIKLGIVV